MTTTAVRLTREGDGWATRDGRFTVRPIRMGGGALATRGGDNSGWSSGHREWLVTDTTGQAQLSTRGPRAEARRKTLAEIRDVIAAATTATPEPRYTVLTEHTDGLKATRFDVWEDATEHADNNTPETDHTMLPNLSDTALAALEDAGHEYERGARWHGNRYAVILIAPGRTSRHRD